LKQSGSNPSQPKSSLSSTSNPPKTTLSSSGALDEDFEMCSLDYVKVPAPQPSQQTRRQPMLNPFLDTTLANAFLPNANFTPPQFRDRLGNDATRIDLNKQSTQPAPRSAYFDARIIQLVCCLLFLLYSFLDGYGMFC
jgi:hypothetical protein